MKRLDRLVFVILVALTVGSGSVALWALVRYGVTASKWAATAGLLATLAGVVQLDVSGLFDRLLEKYSDEEKYPYGPPSYVTRETIDDPDRPYRTRLRNLLFFTPRTGFWLVVAGTVVQVVAVWL